SNDTLGRKTIDIHSPLPRDESHGLLKRPLPFVCSSLKIIKVSEFPTSFCLANNCVESICSNTSTWLNIACASIKDSTIPLYHLSGSSSNQCPLWLIDSISHPSLLS